MVPGEEGSHTTRNREHQRQSRARRKKYVQELESRLRKYETDGVQATHQVQAAARRVVEENRALRELLRQHGICTASVDMHTARIKQVDTRASSVFPAKALLSTKSNASESRPRPNTAQGIPSPDRGRMRQLAVKSSLPSQAMVSRGPQGSTNRCSTDEKLRASQAPTMSPKGGAMNQDIMSTANARLHDHLTETDEQELSAVHNSEDQPNLHPRQDDISTTFSPTCCPATSAVLASRDSPLPSDQIDCEEAARIIASIRGQNHPESLLLELGCSAATRCMVRNIDVFQLV